MIKVYTFTRSMDKFKDAFQNGAEVLEAINASECAEYWQKPQEVLIYDGAGKCLFSCCWTSAYNRNYITSVWSNNGREYSHDIDYDAIEQEIKNKSVPAV